MVLPDTGRGNPVRDCVKPPTDLPGDACYILGHLLLARKTTT
jgi:hypothetical protein